MTNGSTPKPQSASLDLLIKLMKLTTSNVDAEALLALRKANEQLSKLSSNGQKYDWEDLLRGKVTLIADPFSMLPPSPVHSPGRAPAPPPRPAPPPPPPTNHCTSCRKSFTHGGFRAPYGIGSPSDHFCSATCLSAKYPPHTCSVCKGSYSQGSGFRSKNDPFALFCSRVCHDVKFPPYRMPQRGSSARKRPSLGDL